MPKTEFARRDYYDVWLPILSPSQPLLTYALKADDDKTWRTFVKRYRAEMAKPDASRVLDLLAAMSHQTNLAVGCYCEVEARCHRSVLRELLRERGASFAAL